MQTQLKRTLSFNATYKGCEYVGEMYGCEASIFRNRWENNELLFIVMDWVNNAQLGHPPKDSIFRYDQVPDNILIGILVSQAEGDRFCDVVPCKDRWKVTMGNHYIKSMPKFAFPYICMSDSQVDKVEKRLEQLKN